MERNVDISLQMVEDLKIRDRGRGEILGYCPVCGCNDANFNVNLMIWHCWHDHAKGRITSNTGEYVIRDRVEREEKKLDINSIRSFYNKLVDKFQVELPTALDYLMSRGFKEEILNKFKLGFCSTTYYDEYSDEIAEDAGILRQKFPLLSNRITIPYIVDGEVTDIRGRTLEKVFNYKPNTPKYLSLSGPYDARGAVYLFNHDAIKLSNTVMITEGEFKALAAIQNGYPCVATPGISRWHDSWTEQLKGKEVILIPDNEITFGRRKPGYIMAKLLSNKIANLKVATLPLKREELKKGKDKLDIDSFMLDDEGKEVFEIAVKGAQNVKDYLRCQEGKQYGRRKLY